MIRSLLWYFSHSLFCHPVGIPVTLIVWDVRVFSHNCEKKMIPDHVRNHLAGMSVEYDEDREIWNRYNRSSSILFSSGCLCTYFTTVPMSASLISSSQEQNIRSRISRIVASSTLHIYFSRCPLFSHICAPFSGSFISCFSVSVRERPFFVSSSDIAHESTLSESVPFFWYLRTDRIFLLITRSPKYICAEESSDVRSKNVSSGNIASICCIVPCFLR